MAFKVSSWSMKEEVNKAKLKLEIPNFSDVVGCRIKGQKISSEQFDVGGINFALDIYPNGTLNAAKGMLSVFLCNESNLDVAVDYTISIGRGNVQSLENIKIEKGRSWGWVNFMTTSEVRTNLETTVEVELKWRDLSGGVVEKNQVNSKNLVKVDERLGVKLEQMGVKLEQMGGKLELMGGKLEKNMGGKLEQMEQRMKNFVRGEIAKVKATPIPECPVCFLQLKPPKKIVQCLKGHKICEPCSEKEAVVSCPTCKTAFMGRDFGMEAFVRELSGEN